MSDDMANELRREAAVLAATMPHLDVSLVVEAADRIEALEAENETLQAKLTEAQDALASVKSALEAFKAQITSDIKGFKPEPPPGGEGGEAIRKPFKSSK